MTTTTSYLVPSEGGSPALNASAAGLFAAHNVAAGCALTLMRQTPFSNALLSTLPEDQALAAAHAETFQNGWGFGVTNTFLSGLTSISEFVLALSGSALQGTAASLDKQDPDSAAYADLLTSWRAQVEAVIAACCNNDASSGSTLLRMTEIHSKLTDLADEINDDDVRLSTAMDTVDKEDQVAQLSAKQGSLQKDLADVNGEIADGAVSTIGDDLAFGVSFAFGFVDGIGAGAIAGASVAIYGEAKAIDEFNQHVKDLRTKQTDLGAEISDLFVKIGEDKFDLATLTLSAAQVHVFNARIAELTKLTSGIVDQMTDWQSQLEALAAQSRPPSPDFFSDQVAAGISYWTALRSKLLWYSNIIAQSKEPTTSTLG